MNTIPASLALPTCHPSCDSDWNLYAVDVLSVSWIRERNYRNAGDRRIWNFPRDFGGATKSIPILKTRRERNPLRTVRNSDLHWNDKKPRRCSIFLMVAACLCALFRPATRFRFRFNYTYARNGEEMVFVPVLVLVLVRQHNEKIIDNCNVKTTPKGLTPARSIEIC